MENPVWQKSNYVAVWVFLLLHANHEDKQVIWNNKKTIIKRGSYIGSIRKISEHYGMSISTVKYILDYFISERMIEHIATKKFSVFTIVNWDKYQGLEHSTEHKEKSNTTSNENQIKTNKNDKNDKNDKKGSIAGQDPAEISEVINLFKEVNPSYERLFGMPPQRAAVSRLLKTHGKDKLTGMISFLPKSNASRFAPTITTPVQFEQRLGELIAWSQKEKSIAHKGRGLI